MVIPKPNTLLESFDYFRLGDWNNAVALVSKLMISFFSFYFFFSYVYLGQMYLSKKKGKKRKQGKRGVSEGAAFLLGKKGMHLKERCWMIGRILGCFKIFYIYTFYYMTLMYFFLSVLHFAAVGKNNISHQLQPNLYHESCRFSWQSTCPHAIGYDYGLPDGEEGWDRHLDFKEDPLKLFFEPGEQPEVTGC